MIKRYNDETILNKYMDYLSDKGKILRIKDTEQEIRTNSSSGIIFYFLSIISIALIIVSIYLIINFFLSPSIASGNNSIIVIGVALFTAIIIGVNINEKNNFKLNITYPNENQIKFNNKIFDISQEDCYIRIIKNFQNYSNPDRVYSNSYVVKYYLEIRDTRNKRLFPITNGNEEVFNDFIYNFEYEISDFEKQKSESLKNINNVLEELYDKGSVSQETFDKININR